jgi:GNAT superfamily N-acetyltransferase
MSEPFVRAATAADALRLAELRYEFRASVGPPTETQQDFVERASAWMRERLLDEGGAWRCWVVEANGEVRGNVWLQLIEKLPNPVVELEKHGYITNVYLQDSLRGSGLGQRLVEAALECCREEGVDSVILWPTQRSRTLYERYGFAVRDDLFEAVLDDGRQLGHKH